MRISTAAVRNSILPHSGLIRSFAHNHLHPLESNHVEQEWIDEGVFHQKRICKCLKSFGSQASIQGTWLSQSIIHFRCHPSITKWNRTLPIHAVSPKKLSHLLGTGNRANGEQMSEFTPPDSCKPEDTKQLHLATSIPNNAAKDSKTLTNTPESDKSWDRGGPWSQQELRSNGPGVDYPERLESALETEESFRKGWLGNFLQLQRRFDMNHSIPRHQLSVITRMATMEKPLGNLIKARRRIYTRDRPPLIELWGNLMLWCMQNSPRYALQLLFTSSKDSVYKTQKKTILDCLRYLLRRLWRGEQLLDIPPLRTIYHITFELIMKSRNPEAPIDFPGQYTNFLLKYGDIRAYLPIVLEKPGALGDKTLLQFVKYLSARGSISISMRIVRWIMQSGNYSVTHLQATCGDLLLARLLPNSKYRHRSDIVTEMLDMGINLDKHDIHDAMLLDAVDAGEHQKFWDLFLIAKPRRAFLDSRAYSLLLKGAEVCDDPNMALSALHEMSLKGTILRYDPPFLQKVIEAIINQQVKLGQKAFPVLFDLYKRYYYIHPLKELGICSDKDQSMPGSMLQSPPTEIISQVIRHYLTMDEYSEKHLELYYRYHDLVASKHPHFLSTTLSDSVANAFLSTLGKQASNLDHCVTIVRHMLEAVAETKKTRLNSTVETTTAPTGTIVPKCFKGVESIGVPLLLSELAPRNSTTPSPPTARTYTLLAGAFFRHDRNLGAERLLRTMRSKGLEVDTATWSLITIGARLPMDFEAAANPPMTEANKSLSSSLDALSKVWDQHRQVEASKKVIRQLQNIDGPDAVGK